MPRWLALIATALGPGTVGGLVVEKLHDAPLVLQIQHFLSREEIAGIMMFSDAATRNGSLAPQGSSSAYLMNPEHKDSNILRSLARRAASLVGALPALSGENSDGIVLDDVLAAVEPHDLGLLEAFFLTRYTRGQHYGIHHDSVFVPRAWTLLFYLYTVGPEEGGATAFPDLVSRGHASKCAADSGCGDVVADRIGGDGPLASVCAGGDRDNLIAVQPQEGSVLLWQNTVCHLHTLLVASSLALAVPHNSFYQLFTSLPPRRRATNQGRRISALATEAARSQQMWKSGYCSSGYTI
jgi:hypothetical protein